MEYRPNFGGANGIRNISYGQRIVNGKQNESKDFLFKNRKKEKRNYPYYLFWEQSLEMKIDYLRNNSSCAQ